MDERGDTPARPRRSRLREDPWRKDRGLVGPRARAAWVVAPPRAPVCATPRRRICHDEPMTTPTNPFATLEHRRPDVDFAEAARLARTVFGLEGTVRELGSHQDRNFLVDAADGRFVLKVARHGISRRELEAENAAMARVAEAGLPFATPVPQPALDGGLVAEAETAAGRRYDVRLVTWIDGEPLGESRHLAPVVLRAHGALAARIAIALDGFEHPGLDRTFQWDLRHAEALVAALGGYAS